MKEGMDLKTLNKCFLYIIVFFSYLSLAHNAVLGGGAMEISSSAFKDGGKIPVQYVMPGAGGKNISIPLAWKNTPAGTKSFALSIVDPHPVAQHWVHWFVITVLHSVTAVADGAQETKS